MPANFLNESERTKLSQIPVDILEIDLNKYFTLTPEDIQQVKQQRQLHNKLGFAIQLCALRFLGLAQSVFQGVEQMP